MSAPTGLYRHQTKTPAGYLIGLGFDLDMGGFYEALWAPKRENQFWFWFSSDCVKPIDPVNTASTNLARAMS